MKFLKTLLLFFCLLLYPCLAVGRDATFAWDPNPPEENVTEYRLERWDVDHWEVMGRVTDTGTGVPTQLRVPDFPNAATKIRAFAINVHGESDPSAELTIPAVPGKPEGLRYTITISAVSLYEPGQFVIIEQSTDLVQWKEIARGWSHVVAAVPEKLPRAFFRAQIKPA